MIIIKPFLLSFPDTAEVTVYYDANAAVASGVQASGSSSSGCKPSLIHLESQLEHNRTRRSFWQKLRPARLPLTQEGSLANHYLISVGRNSSSMPGPFAPQAANDHLLPMQDLHAHVHPHHHGRDMPADNQSIPDDSSLQGDGLQEAAGEAGAAANVSIYSMDSGIVAGLDQHMTVSDL